MTQEERVTYLNQLMPSKFFGKVGDVNITANVTCVELKKNAIFGDKIVIHVVEISGSEVVDGEPEVVGYHHTQNNIGVRYATYYVDESAYDQQAQTLAIPGGEGEIKLNAKL